MSHLLANQRREKILDLIRERGHAKVIDLSRIFKVTEVTIRQDLERLAKDGLVEREHGGAFLKNMGKHINGVGFQEQTNLAEKMVIAQKAADLIKDGDTIILDSGSTTTEIAKLLSGYKKLTVLTNSLNIALILGVKPEITLVMTGGEFDPSEMALNGKKAVDFFQDINIDKLFLGVSGISKKSGLTYPGIRHTCVKKAMIESASEVFLVADSTKIGVSSFASLGPLSMVGTLITDSKIPKEYIEILRENQVDLILADAPE